MEFRHFALKDIDTIFPAPVLKKAEKCPLREVEETEKGQWVAFADDGPESFDVQITLQKGEVIAHSCDCGKPDALGFCLHQVAMLKHLAAKGSKTVKQVATRKTKEDPISNLLSQLEPDELKSWLKEVLHQQKYLAVAFTNRFAPKPENYSAEEIYAITDAAVKSVVKNKRKIDQSELKKILQLWKEVHEPIITNYLSDIATPEKTIVLNNLLFSIQKWNEAFNINSIKITTYKRDILARVIQPLYDIQQETTWQNVIKAYFIHGLNTESAIGSDWLVFLAGLPALETRQHRVGLILELFKNKYQGITGQKDGTVTAWFTELVYNMYKHAGKVVDCIPWIQPITYQNAYNLELVDSLIENKLDVRAEKICLDLIKSNFRDEYDFPYQTRLAEIYRRQPQSREKLYSILMELLPHHGTLEDYLVILDEHFKNREEDGKKWRSKILNALGSAIRSSPESATLYFSILNLEKKYAKMVEKLGDSCTSEVAAIHFENLFKHDKPGLLKQLSRIGSGYYETNEDEVFYPLLAVKVKEHYSGFEIMSILLKGEPYWRGRFSRFYERLLKGDTIN